LLYFIVGIIYRFIVVVVVAAIFISFRRHLYSALYFGRVIICE